MNNEKLNKNYSKAVITFVAIVMAAVVIFCCAYTDKINNDNDPKKCNQVRGSSRNIKVKYRLHDNNDTHLAAGQQFGIQPLASRNNLDSALINKLKKAESSNLYQIDKLTHSVPYLTSGAYDLLNTIATNFQSKLRKQGIAQYKIVVTSLLRTNDDVERLRLVNRNAIKQSSHLYATTFDITYTRFDKVENNPDFSGSDASHRELVNILGETLKELHDNNLCYVNTERGQPCYHITSRR